MSRIADEVSFLAKGTRLLSKAAAGNLFFCNWQLTYRCDFRCSTCLFWREEHRAQDELTLPQIEQALRALEPLAPLGISVSGGEALLREDLPDVIALMAREHFPSIITNGWHVTPGKARRLYEAGLGDVHVSVDYASAARHDAQRGQQGAFAKAMDALEMFRDARPSKRNRVHVMALLLEDNLDDIEKLVLLAEELGVSVELSLYSHRRGKLPRRDPTRPVAEFLRQLKAHHPATFVSMGSYLEAFDRAVQNQGVPSCQAGITFFNVDEKGNVGLCINDLERPVGNLLKDDGAVLLERLRDRGRGNPCGQCWTSCRGMGDVINGPASFVRAMPDVYRALRPL